LELDNEVTEQRYSMQQMAQEISICRGVIANLIAEKDRLEFQLTDQRETFESEISRLAEENKRLSAKLRNLELHRMKQEETEHQGVDVDDFDDFSLLDPRSDPPAESSTAIARSPSLRQLTLQESFQSHRNSLNRNESLSSDCQDADST
jgi:hypothetical protein